MDEICCENIRETKPDEISKPPQTRSCGLAFGDNIQTRILSPDSKSTKFGELPWNLIIQEVDNTKQNLFKCGASLIHPKAALTAAHCVSSYLEEPDLIIVRGGEWDINSKDESLPHQDRQVEEILIHPNYNVLSLKNDISLLFLNEDFILGKNIGVVCLPSPGRKLQETGCIASGWGKDGFKSGKYSSVMRKIELSIVQREKCVFSLRTTRLGALYNLHRSFICAGGEKNKDACKGDGGSPLVCPVSGGENRWAQMGIVSWGIGCGTEGVPGVYVNVGLFLEWIDVEMSDRGLDTDYYRF